MSGIGTDADALAEAHHQGGGVDDAELSGGGSRSAEKMEMQHAWTSGPAHNIGLNARWAVVCLYGPNSKEWNLLPNFYLTLKAPLLETLKKKSATLKKKIFGASICLLAPTTELTGCTFKVHSSVV